MNRAEWFRRKAEKQQQRGRRWKVMGSAVVALLAMAAAAQAPAPDQQPVAPRGYTLHETIEMGGHMAGISGSGAMYDTMVNLRSGPRVLGETFELRALPGAKNTLVDSLSAFSNGWGGDPDNYARLDFHKGRLYEFSGLFRRDRQYFDYDLLGNPNVPSGQSIAVSGGSPLPLSQVQQSPFLFNTVRRMTDSSITLLPLSKVSYRVSYSQDIFQGPSLTPSGFWELVPPSAPFVLVYDTLLEEMQRNSTDDFLGAVDWKPVRNTRLTFEEQVDHYKANSYFMANPASFNVQEPDGTKAALLASYDSLTPYNPAASCNTASMGSAPPLSAPNTPGGLPIVNPACAVMLGYQRYQPTRILYPTEIFRFQSSGIRNVTMNGDIRYTQANMSLPSYYENFNGLTTGGRSGAMRDLTYTASASARRKVTAVDYGVDWQTTQKVGFSDQFTFSNVQQPGTSVVTGATALLTPASNESVTYQGALTSVAVSPLSGNSSVGVPLPGFLGQKWVTNDVTGTWDGFSRATISLTWRYRQHVIAEGVPHSGPITTCLVYNAFVGSCGTVTIHQNGGVLNVALRPFSIWDINGSAELLYADNAFVPVAPRQLQHYRIHTLYRVKTWATISGAYNDLERHNNTNNTGTAPPDGPLDHVDHSRVVSAGAQVFPNQHFGFDLDYSYSDIYTATNICYDAAASATLPGAATPSGTACPATSPVRGVSYYDFGPVRDFMDAPTQSGSAAISLSPVSKLGSNIGYRISSVDGNRFYNDARDVAGSLVSTWQSPFINLAYTVHPGFIWKAEYNFYGYGEGGPSGAQYCSTSNPTPGSPAPVVPCNSPTLAGLQTGETISPAGETAPRNFHGHVVTLSFHYEF